MKLSTKEKLRSWAYTALFYACFLAVGGIIGFELFVVLEWVGLV